MALSEERLQLLLPRALKASARQRARHLGVSVGAYIRRLIEADVHHPDAKASGMEFPFGERPISTGRTLGSVEHDRA